MPQDKFGHPYFYPTKTGGFNYEMSSDPKNDSPMEGLDSDFSVSGGIITMHPNGPTSFSVGRNGRSFSDSIGGCDMDFGEAAHRGYTYKANDVRDLEFKCVMKVNSIGDHGFSMSCCTGHHSADHCCQGFAYMGTMETGTNPVEFRFRKEMWHVSYHDSPEGVFKSSKLNFKLDGHGWFGYGFVRYNEPVSGGNSPDDDNVVLEVWANPTPEDDPTNWFMIKRIKDKKGNGWGDDGDDCNGDKDQVGVWSGAHNRLKTNATSGSINFKEITFREIDPFGTFDDNPSNPPPDTGSTVSRDLVYAAVGTSGEQIDPNNYYLNSIVVAHEIVESLTDPDPLSVLGPDSWFDPASGDEIADICGIGHQYGTGEDSYWLRGYWSNSDNNCVIPRVNLTDLGSSTRVKNPHGGPVLVNAKIFMIFWGTDWKNRTAAPTGAGFIDRIQNRLLGTDKEYFARLTQYGGITAPTWGGAAYNTTFPIPSGSGINEDQGERCIIDTFNKGLLPIPKNPNEDLYILMIPIGKQLSHDNLSTPNGFHGKFRASITIPPPITDPPGTPPPPTPTPTPTTTTVRGLFTLRRNINVYHGEGACSGAGVSSFYNIGSTGGDKYIVDKAEYFHRTRIAEFVADSSSSFNGTIPLQFDIQLRKVGVPGASPTISAKIWDSRNVVVYTSPTALDPTTLTTSFASYTFAFATNTHVMQTGDRIGVEWTGVGPDDYISATYTDRPDAGHHWFSSYESGVWVNTANRDLAAIVYD